ncbi:hypothetical protein FACS1894202_00780 [Clostridia bacterium]|nr:hypothetical protein FACS1894202_00780 [Clostridia bacterium]
MDDYLDAIYSLGDARDPVRMTDVALRLGISKASVSHAVRALVGRGLVTHARYGTIGLTDEGFELAQGIHQRRAVFGRFLAERLGVSDEVAARDAGLMERVASAETLVALEKFMG